MMGKLQAKFALTLPAHPVNHNPALVLDRWIGQESIDDGAQCVDGVFTTNKERIQLASDDPVGVDGRKWGAIHVW